MATFRPVWCGGQGMIQLREFQRESDYGTVETWWKGHGWPAVPLEMLPKLGMVAVNEGEPCAAGWVYLDNSTGVGMMEWLVSNPANPMKVSAVALGRLVDCLKGAAHALGYGAILASCRQESLSRLMEREGFTRTDEEVIHLLSLQPIS